MSLRLFTSRFCSFSPFLPTEEKCDCQSGNGGQVLVERLSSRVVTRCRAEKEEICVTHNRPSLSELCGAVHSLALVERVELVREEDVEVARALASRQGALPLRALEHSDEAAQARRELVGEQQVQHLQRPAGGGGSLKGEK